MESKRDIENRDDVFTLVTTFYSEKRKDEVLGPIFNKRLTSKEIWDVHLIKLTDFWETNLFNIIKFNGNPMKSHQETDKAMNYGITQDHFVDWLGIWSKTINSLFEGEKAELAKEKARRMSTHLYVDIVKHKPKTTE